MSFISNAYAQSEAPAEGQPASHDVVAGPAGETHATTEARGGEHGTFPPFDPATFAPQLFWLIVCFGALLLLMSRVALPRVASILEERSNRIAGDLAQAARMKEQSDAAIAAHEQALAEARRNAHQIAQQARDAAKTEIDADRKRVEGDLQGKLAAAEAEITGVKTRALAEVDSIARDAVETMVEVLVGTKAGKAEVQRAVEAAMAERA